MSRKTIRVLLVDDHAVVREGYSALLSQHDGMVIIGEACDAVSAYQSYKDTRPDIVIMDISMPGRGGIDAIEHIRQLDANARILVFTMHCGAAYALQAFRAGAKGYVTKSSTPDILINAVREIAEGRIIICPEVSEELALDVIQEERTGLQSLSPREFEILLMILDTRSTDEIASALNVSRKTVANYHYNIKSKLGVASDIELLYFGLRQGLVARVLPTADAKRSDCHSPRRQ
jgi:two-component system invasion response regulator UvrY